MEGGCPAPCIFLGRVAVAALVLFASIFFSPAPLYMIVSLREGTWSVFFFFVGAMLGQRQRSRAWLTWQVFALLVKKFV